jgi:hypothetical protein
MVFHHMLSMASRRAYQSRTSSLKKSFGNSSHHRRPMLSSHSGFIPGEIRANPTIKNVVVQNQIPKKNWVRQNNGRLVRKDPDPKPIIEVAARVHAPQNPNVMVEGIKIPQTWGDYFSLNTRYKHHFTYSIDGSIGKSCEIITMTPILKATISYRSHTESHTNFGGSCGNTITSTDCYPILVGNDEKTIHEFDIKAPCGEMLLGSTYDFRDISAPNGYSNFVLNNFNETGVIKTTNNKFIKNGVSCVSFW